MHRVGLVGVGGGVGVLEGGVGWRGKQGRRKQRYEAKRIILVPNCSRR